MTMISPMDDRADFPIDNLHSTCMKRLRSLNKLVLLLIFMQLHLSAFAQRDTLTSPQVSKNDSTRIYRIELRDGSIYMGSILQEDREAIQFSTLSSSQLTIRKYDIVKREIISTKDFNNGTYWFKNPNPTRYLFGPSAYNLKAGEGYYQNTYLFLNSFNVGVTDNLSIGGGFEVISMFSGTGPIFILTPKIGFNVAPKFNVGGGVLYLSVPGFFSGSRTGLGIGYGVATYGSENSNITGGMGWGFVEGRLSSTPVITISGMHRVSRKVALVTENWLIPVDSYYGLYSYGIRFFGEKLAVDLAFINNRDISTAIALGIPYVDFVVKF
jgi:hypothetical protein